MKNEHLELQKIIKPGDICDILYQNVEFVGYAHCKWQDRGPWGRENECRGCRGYMIFKKADGEQFQSCWSYNLGKCPIKLREKILPDELFEI